jgi:hypothetical protein
MDEVADEDRRLQALLAEHQITRQEISATNARKASYIQFFLVFLGASYGFILHDDEVGLLPLVGLGCVAFLAAWAFEHELVLLLSNYLRDNIEKNLAELLHEAGAGRSVDWQRYYRDNLPRRAAVLYRAVAVGLYGIIGVLPKSTLSRVLVISGMHCSC